MSLTGALSTANSGLLAESAAFGNISDNVANSQSVGFKGVNTSFEDLLTTSNALVNEPGTVQALPNYTNEVQGTLTQSTDPLALAISGSGFFAVNTQDGTTADNQPEFAPQISYTRAGDFSLDSAGYLVNSAGGYLQGWTVNPTTGQVDQTQLQTIQVNQSAFSPVATNNVNVSANLPPGASYTKDFTSKITVYDSLGNVQELNVTWSGIAANIWNVQFTTFGSDGTSTEIGNATVTFNNNSSGSSSAAPDGTLASITGDSVNVTANTPQSTDSPASVTLACNFDGSPQDITINMGDFGQSSGVTQFAGTTYDERSITQDGAAAGGFTGISMETSGDVMANYSNGQSRLIAQVPVVTFNAPDALQRENGQMFAADEASGTPIAQSAGSNQAGSLVTGSVEGSNVDIATEFTKMIVTQEAYSANTKVVTTADTLTQDAINMKQ